MSADEVSKAVDGLFNPQQTARINSADTALNQLTSSFANLQEADMMLKRIYGWLLSKTVQSLPQMKLQTLNHLLKLMMRPANSILPTVNMQHTNPRLLSLGNSKAARDIINSTDKYYKDQQSKLSGYQSELSAALNKALSDGRIDINEEESLNTIRQKLQKSQMR